MQGISHAVAVDLAMQDQEEFQFRDPFVYAN